jgi:pantoate--beta-alanine ligase
VTQIVKKLLDVVQPDVVFLGQKDYQQYLVISKMVKALKLAVKLVLCPIVRDKYGLALSSRNMHLSDAQRKQSLVLHKVLKMTKENFNKKTIPQLKADATAILNNDSGVEPEYFEICDARDLSLAESKRLGSIIALVAARVGSTRLIDNTILK